MGWQTFSRISEPSYPNLVRCFYANLTQPRKYCLVMHTTIGDKTIKVYAPGFCRLLRAPNEGDDVYDSNAWPTINNFDS